MRLAHALNSPLRSALRTPYAIQFHTPRVFFYYVLLLFKERWPFQDSHSFEHLHNVSLHELDAKFFRSEKFLRDPEEKYSGHDVLEETPPEGGRVQLAGVVPRRRYLGGVETTKPPNYQNVVV